MAPEIEKIRSGQHLASTRTSTRKRNLPFITAAAATTEKRMRGWSRPMQDSLVFCFFISIFCLFFVSMEMYLFPTIMHHIADCHFLHVWTLLYYVVRFPPGWCFPPCDHGLDFDIISLCENSSMNQPKRGCSIQSVLL